MERVQVMYPGKANNSHVMGEMCFFSVKCIKGVPTDWATISIECVV